MYYDIALSFRSYFTAFGLIRKLRLWKFLLIPGLISLVLALTFGLTAWGMADNIGQFLIQWWPWEWGIQFIGSIAGWAGSILLLILGLIIYKHAVIVIASPFMSPLAERIELHLTGRDKSVQVFSLRRAIQEMGRGLRLSVRNLVHELFFVFLFFLLSFIPVLGVVTSICIFIVQAYYAGFGNMDYTLERHIGVQKSIRFVKQYKGLAVGNGTVFIALLMTGIGFAIAPPLATIAAAVATVPRLNLQESQLAVEDFV